MPMTVAAIETEVQAFQAANAFGVKPADCFPAWYLKNRFILGDSDAKSRCADVSESGEKSGHDSGIDGFHLYESDGKRRLLLIQSKYSEAPAGVKKGFKDFQKSGETLRRLLDGVPPEGSQENKVVWNLRAELNGLSPEERKELVLEFLVLHKCPSDHEILTEETKHVRGETREELDRHIGDWNFILTHVGPLKLDFQGSEGTFKSQPVSLRVLAHEFSAEHKGKTIKMFHGVGRLSDLVDLYGRHRDDLFSKNVRYFIKSAKNVERGPSAKMRETLSSICIKKDTEPGLFAFLHNGVTLVASTVKQEDDGLDVVDPRVLNGCQTIKTAHLFRYDPRLKGKIDDERWKEVRIPVRITITKDEGLVQTITVSNNRQNAITSAALRANDPVQIRLEQRFAQAKIFYERQEGHHDHIRDTAPERLDQEFPYSNQMAVKIEDLARAIASCLGMEGLAWAAHPNQLFESDTIYGKVFNPERTLKSVTFLTFLRNAREVIPVVLKSDFGLTRREPKGPIPDRLVPYALALLVRHLAKAGEEKFVFKWGDQLYGKKSEPFRAFLKKELGPQHSGIKTHLVNDFLSLEESGAEFLRKAYFFAEKDLGLTKGPDPFEYFSELDEVETEG